MPRLSGISAFRPSRDYLGVSAPIAGESAFDYAAQWGDGSHAMGGLLYSLSEDAEATRGGGQGHFRMFRRELLREPETLSELAEHVASLLFDAKNGKGGEEYRNLRRLYRWIRSRMVDASEAFIPLADPTGCTVDTLAQALLWASLTDEDLELGVLDPLDFGKGTLERLRTAWEAFWEENRETFAAEDWSEEQAAHDFAMDVSGTGAGFRDHRELREVSDRLSESARKRLRHAAEQICRDRSTGRCYLS